MSRTDKDRPSEVRWDDPTEKRWHVEHRHGVKPCDYSPVNNVLLFKQRHSSELDFSCSGMLGMPSRGSYPSSKRDRRRMERSFRRTCREMLSSPAKANTMLSLRHPKQLVQVRGR